MSPTSYQAAPPRGGNIAGRGDLSRVPRGWRIRAERMRVAGFEAGRLRSFHARWRGVYTGGMHRFFVLGTLISSFGLAGACGSDESSGTPPTSNEGGPSDTGGAGSGGATGSGGSRTGGATGR